MKRVTCWLLLIGLNTAFLGNALAQPEPMDDPVLPEKLDKLTPTLDPGGHTAHVRKVFFTPDGKQVISLGQDHSIRIWDVVTGETVKVLHPPGVGGLFVAALSPDGKRLALASRYPVGDNLALVIYLLALPEGRIERVLQEPQGTIQAIAFSSDGRRLAASTTRPAATWLWDLDKGGPGQVIFKNGSSGLAFSPDGSRLAGVGPRFAILDLATGKEGAKLAGEKMVAWSPDGKILATARGIGGYALWNPDGTARPHSSWTGFVHTLAFSSDSTKLLVVGRTGRNLPIASIVDAATGKVLLHCQSEKGQGPGPDTDGAFSPDGQLVVTGGALEVPVVTIWQAKDGAILKRLLGKPWITGGAAYLRASWTPDGKSVAWKWDTYRPAFKPPTFDLGELKFGPNQDMKDLHAGTETDLATLSKLKGKGILIGEDRAAEPKGLNIALLDLTHSKVIRSFTGHNSTIPLRHLAPSPDGRYLLSFAFDQMLNVWSLDKEREKPLLTLYVNGQDWVVSTPEGYYAATPGGERMVGWKVDNGINQMPSFYAVERFRKQLYRPDVIKLVLEKGSVEEALKAANAALPKEQRPKTDGLAEVTKLLPPTVTLTLVKKADDGTVTLRADAKPGAKEQPIQSLRVMVDGRRLPEPQGFSENKTSDTWTLPLPPGKHQVLVLARSADAAAISNKLEIDSRPLKEKPVMHVLAIGIDHYQDKDLNLSCAVNDANLIASTFAKECQGELFEKVGAKKLLNKEATRDQLLKEVRQLRTTTKSGDLVVVFFAGHGAKQKDQFYLLTHEALVDDLAKTTLSGATLREELKEFPCQVLLLLDACHSAGFGAKGKLAKNNLKPATDDATRTFTDDEVGVVVMCAAMGYEKAEERGKNGLFTQALVEALTASQPPQQRKGQQYVHHLHSYVFDKVADKSDDKQHPFLHLPWTIESFPVRRLSQTSPGAR